MIRVGLAGYGLAGATFHAPLIEACEDMTLAAVMTSRDAPCAVRSLDEMIDRSGRTTVPQIFIDGRHVGGCDDLFALEHSGKLDPLLG